MVLTEGLLDDLQCGRFLQITFHAGQILKRMDATGQHVSEGYPHVVAHHVIGCLARARLAAAQAPTHFLPRLQITCSLAISLCQHCLDIGTSTFPSEPRLCDRVSFYDFQVKFPQRREINIECLACTIDSVVFAPHKAARPFDISLSDLSSQPRVVRQHVSRRRSHRLF